MSGGAAYGARHPPCKGFCARPFWPSPRAPYGPPAGGINRLPCDTLDPRPRGRVAAGAGSAMTAAAGHRARDRDDRPLHLEHAERPQGLDHARGVRPRLRGPPDRHYQGPAARPRLPQDQPEQQNPGHRRPRQRLERLRVRRHPDLPGREDRQAPPAGSEAAHPDTRVADVPDGRRRPDARPGAPLPEVQRRQGALRRAALRGGGEAPLRRDGPPPGREPLPRHRRLHDRRHRDLALDLALRVAGCQPRRLPERPPLVRRGEGPPGRAARLRRAEDGAHDPGMRRLQPGDRLVLATHNPGKVREFDDFLRPYGLTVVSAASLGLPEPEETGTTFAENARLKAVAAATASGLPALADDSGVVVHGLDGAPGVYSADWAGPGRDFRPAMRRVLDDLAERYGSLERADRRAAFVATLCLAWPDGQASFHEGRVDGEIAPEPRGTGGFGYDPIFIPEGERRTFGEMSPAEKARLSHRARAFATFAAAELAG